MINLSLLTVALIWGVNFAVVKSALADFHPLSFTIVRFALSTLFLLAVMLARREPLAVDRQDRSAFFVLGLIGIALYNLFFMYGINFTTASNSALFISASPIFSAVILSRSRLERITGQTAAGLLVSFLGALILIQSRPEGLSFTRRGMAGDLLTLCAALFWALYTVKAKPLLGKYSALKVTAYSMASGTLLLAPAGAPQLLSQSWDRVSALSWAALAFSAFLSGGVAFTLWYQGVKKIGVSRTVVYHYLVPFVAVIFASLFLGERITVLQIIGGAAIIGGVVLVQKKETSAPGTDQP